MKEITKLFKQSIIHNVNKFQYSTLAGWLWLFVPHIHFHRIYLQRIYLAFFRNSHIHVLGLNSNYIHLEKLHPWNGFKFYQYNHVGLVSLSDCGFLCIYGNVWNTAMHGTPMHNTKFENVWNIQNIISFVIFNLNNLPVASSIFQITHIHKFA